MEIEDIAQRISLVDELETWGILYPDLDRASKSQALKLAEPMWVRRMLNEHRLLVHPDVAKDLENQQWLPNDLQKRMIWASVLANSDQSNSKERFADIKKRLISKYDRDWWEDVYKRIKPAFAAKQRIIKNLGSYGPVVSMMAKSTVLIASAVEDERNIALRMIPKN